MNSDQPPGHVEARLDRLRGRAKAERGVVVDSPPGAGKSTLVVAAAALLAEQGERVMVVGQTNEQVDDLIDRMAGEHGVLRIGRLSAQDYTPSVRVARHANVTARTAVADLIDHPLVIATAAKWALLTNTGLDTEARWPWAIIDEAYQMRSDSLLRIAHLFNKALFVGDPGQLDPFSTVETERWLGLNWDPMSSAVAMLLTNNSGIPVHTLPVSWRSTPARSWRPACCCAARWRTRNWARTTSPPTGSRSAWRTATRRRPCGAR